MKITSICAKASDFCKSEAIEVKFIDIEMRRRRLGITQRDLCLEADVNQSTYSRYQNGREPTSRIMSKLNSALDRMAKTRGVALLEGSTNECAA